MTLSSEILRLKTQEYPSLNSYKRLTDRVVSSVLRDTWRYQSYGPTPLLHQKQGLLAAAHVPSGMIYRYEQGLGKSKLLLDTFVLDRGRSLSLGQAYRGVIFCKNDVAAYDWGKECLKHRPDIRALIVPEELEEKKTVFIEKIYQGFWDLLIIDYSSVQTLFTGKRTVKDKNEFVVDKHRCEEVGRLLHWAAFDELHKVKERTTLRAATLNYLVHYCLRRYGSTGTLFNGDLQQIWTEAFLIDRGRTFGTTLSAFRATYCKEVFDPFARTKKHWEFDFDKFDLFQERLSSLVLNYDLEECVDLPGLRTCSPELRMTLEQQDLYRERIMTAVQKRKKGELDAVWVDLRRILSGFAPGREGIPLPESPKLGWVLKALDANVQEPWVIFYEYTAHGAHLVEQLESKFRVGWLYSGTKSKLEVRRQWDAGKLDVLVMQNVVGAESIELQRARRLIFFEPPCSSITKSQAQRRIYRLGQDRVSYIYEPHFPGTVESTILRRAQEGMTLHQALLSCFSPRTARAMGPNSS